MFVGTMPPGNDTVAFPFLFVVLIFMPVLGIVSWYRLRKREPQGTKRQRYIRTIVMHATLLVFAVAVASHENFSLFPSFSASAIAWSLAALFLVLVLRKVGLKWSKVDEARKKRMSRLLPETLAEFKYWAVISFLAGVGEECSYRGVAFSLLFLMTGSALAAMVVCVVAFAVAHMSQGWRGTVGAGVLAALFHLMVAATGSLYLAMAFHVAYDLLLGVVVMRLLQREKAALDVTAQIAERPA